MTDQKKALLCFALAAFCGALVVKASIVYVTTLLAAVFAVVCHVVRALVIL